MLFSFLPCLQCLLWLKKKYDHGNTEKHGKGKMRAELKGYSKHKTFCFSLLSSVLSVPSVVEKRITTTEIRKRTERKRDDNAK